AFAGKSAQNASRVPESRFQGGRGSPAAQPGCRRPPLGGVMGSAATAQVESRTRPREVKQESERSWSRSNHFIHQQAASSSRKALSPSKTLELSLSTLRYHANLVPLTPP